MSSLPEVSWRSFVEGPEPWEFLGKVARAITGREVEVLPGTYPTALRVFPHRHLSRVTLPPAWLARAHDRPLRGALSHELLHVMYSDPDALAGIAWAVHLIANALEDARLETQCETSWPGLVRPVRALTRDVLAVREFVMFLNRRKRLARDASSAKVYEVSLALYLLLMRLDRAVISRTVNEMAVAIAQEVLPLAQTALTAKDTGEVVEIAKRIIEELERAAESAAQKAKSPAAQSYTHAFRRQLSEAMKITAEEMLVRLSLTERPREWAGPFAIGGGGLPFHSREWAWEAAEAPALAAPDRTTLVRWLMHVDPHHEVEQVLTQQPFGRLATDPHDLIQAATGRSRRVFTRVVRTQRLVLPHLLRSTEFVFLVEAHKWYARPSRRLLLDTVASLARLLTLCHSRFGVRAWTLTQPEEEVEDPVTKRRFRRGANEYHVHIRTLKSMDETWGHEREAVLASLPLLGFNNPFEGYKRALEWGGLPPRATRKRVVLCFGDARHLNIRYLHELRHATAHLRKPDQLAVYVHVGTSIDAREQLAGSLDTSFDGWIQARTVHEAVARTLRQLIPLLAR